MNRTLAALAATALATAAHADPESTDPIRLSLHDWSGQQISSQIMGDVLQSAGYNVEYVQADPFAQFVAMKTGEIALDMEMWATVSREAIAAAVDAGGVVNLGETGLQAREEWWYPSYMEEVCPGLPDWTALNDCAREFATPETAPFGRYLGGPVTWGGFDEERIEALGLDYEVVHAGTDAALFAELDSAYQRKAPILLWIYSPHWATAKYDGKFIEFPEYTTACYDDPSWGINPDMAYDCGKPQGPVWKVGWDGIEGKWPGAYKAIVNFRLSNKEYGDMVARVDLEGASVEAVAQEWLDSHQDVWKAWFN